MDLHPDLRNEKQIRYCLKRLQPLNPDVIKQLYNVLDELINTNEQKDVIALANKLIDDIDDHIPFEGGDMIHRFVVEYKKVVDEYCMLRYRELNR